MKNIYFRIFVGFIAIIMTGILIMPSGSLVLAADTEYIEEDLEDEEDGDEDEDSEDDEDDEDDDDWEDELEPPDGVKVVQTAATSARITWNKVAEAYEYVVYRSSKKNGDYKELGIVSSNSFSDRKASAGKTWYYVVASLNEDEESDDSEVVKVTMLAEPNIKASSSKKNQASVSWKKVSGAAGYEVYASNKKSSGYKKKVTLTKTNSTIKKLKSKKNYYFKVRAYRKVSGKKVFGAYSKPKNVKIK